MTVIKPKLYQKGLTLRQKGESVESFRSKTVDYHLLSAHPQVEVIEIALLPDSRLVLTPAGSAVETFYILAGQLSYTSQGSDITVKAGDHIVTQTLEEPVILTSLSESRLLYVTSQPQFHEISDMIGQLRNLAIEVEMKDGYTADHCDRLQRLSFATGTVMGLNSSSLFLLDFGAYLHDIGKVSIPLDILNKPAKLTTDEWRVVKEHPTEGRKMLEATFMKEAGKIVEQHHERPDGSGYPFGLNKNELMIEAAIVAVADTYDAMTTDRSYRKAMPQSEALEELNRLVGVHYDKEVVRAFTSIVGDVDTRG